MEAMSSAQRGYRRLTQLIDQIGSVETKDFQSILAPISCVSDASDEFAVDNMRLRAKMMNYGSITAEVINALQKCVANPSVQITYDKAPGGSTSSTTPPVVLSTITPEEKRAEMVRHRTLKQMSADRSHFDPIPPALVISPLSTEEVSSILKVCTHYRIPVNPSGTRTGLEGSSLAILPGVVLDMSKMDKIGEINYDEHLITIQPGVEKVILGHHLKKYGYFFPVDPGSNACIGGYASTGASGTLSAKYGTIRENLRTMKVVLSNGDVMQTRSRAVKSSVGYNLHQLLIGSEGTLCVVTELTLAIQPIPKAVLSARCIFPSTRTVSECVADLVKKKGISQLARAELVNAKAMAAVNMYSKTNYDEKPTLFLEFHGANDQDVQSASLIAKQVAETYGGAQFISTNDQKETDTMWEARRNAAFAAKKLRDHELDSNGKPKHIIVFVTDVCVPVHLLPEAVESTEKDFATLSSLPCPIVGHVADGNFHCLIPYDANNKDEITALTALNDRMVHRAIDVGGTASGEHGVGLGKMKFLVKERGDVAVDAMRKIKKALDPFNIMNPFKVFTPLPCEM